MHELEDTMTCIANEGSILDKVIQVPDIIFVSAKTQPSIYHMCINAVVLRPKINV